jgi:hypothetical protein
MLKHISLAIPHYNNTDFIKEAITVGINDDRINEIIICDDKSKDIDILENILNELNCSKIKLYKNDINLGCFKNKILSVSKCSNEWTILLDSDNVIDTNYINTLYNITNWSDDLIYAPSWAITFPNEPSPNLDFRIYNNKIIDNNAYINEFTNIRFQCLINDCNYFVNTKKYTECMNKIVDYYRREEMDCVDSAVLFTEWLLSNNKVMVIENLHYKHRLHPNSNYVTTCSRSNPELILNQLLNKIKNL